MLGFEIATVVRPKAKATEGPNASRRNTYCPPLLGNRTPSSAAARPPARLRIPPTVHAAIMSAADGRCSATEAGARKIPEPMIRPTTRARASHIPMTRRSSPSVLEPETISES